MLLAIAASPEASNTTLMSNPRMSRQLFERMVAVMPSSKEKRGSGKPYYAVWLAFVRQPLLEAALLTHFTGHPNQQVRYAVLQRADCPPAVRAHLRTAAAVRTLPAPVLADPGTSPAAMRAFLPRAGWVERLAMLHNPHLPEDILTTPTHDAHRLVRAAARQRTAIGQVPDLTTPATA